MKDNSLLSDKEKNITIIAVRYDKLSVKSSSSLKNCFCVSALIGAHQIMGNEHTSYNSACRKVIDITLESDSYMRYISGWSVYNERTLREICEIVYSDFFKENKLI